MHKGNGKMPFTANERKPKSVKKLKQFKEREQRDLKRSSDRKVQAKKSIGRMPWHQEPKKDVTSCDKLR